MVGNGSPEVAPLTTDESFPSLPSFSGDLVGAREQGSMLPEVPPPAGEQPQEPSNPPHVDSSSVPSQSKETSTHCYPSRFYRPRQIFELGTD